MLHCSSCDPEIVSGDRSTLTAKMRPDHSVSSGCLRIDISNANPGGFQKFPEETAVPFTETPPRKAGEKLSDDDGSQGDFLTGSFIIINWIWFRGQRSEVRSQESGVRSKSLTQSCAEFFRRGSQKIL